MNNSVFPEVFEDFVSLFFPRYCRGCQDALVKGEELICTACILEMPKSNYHLDPENPFFRRFRGRIPATHVMALFKFVKESRVQHILHALKYKNQPEIGQMLGRVYGEDLVIAGYRETFDLIIPVPLHASRRRSRGYNQSEEFGKGLSEKLAVPCRDDLVERVVTNDTQTRKTRIRRWQNVKENFRIKDPAPFQGKHILLIDDVMTTGATLEACGSVLWNAGCSELSIACIAATQ